MPGLLRAFLFSITFINYSMKKIITLTLNPALDKNIMVDELIPEKKLRCKNPEIAPGGGGVNVSRALNNIGIKSKAFYVAGGNMGKLFTSLLKNESVATKVIQVEDELRENIIVVDNSNNKQYRFGMQGAAVSKEKWNEVLTLLEKENFDIIIASGSLPPGVPTNFYKKLAALVNKKKSKLIIDTSGAALKDAVDEGVFLIKPNLAELSSLYGKKELKKSEAEKAAKEIIAKGYCEVIVVSLGAEGAMLVTKDECHSVKAPEVKKKTTVGAGDSMVAGIVAALHKNYSWEDVLTYAVACGSAATITGGTALCNKKDVEHLFKKLSIK